MSGYKMVDVNLDFARQTLKEVEESRGKMMGNTAFKFEYRDLYTEELYYVIDSIGKDENRLERARIQQVVRECIEAAEKDVQQLVKQRLNEADDPPEPDKVPKVIQTKSVELTSSKNERKPWLPRVALLPPRRLALQQKIQEKEVHTRIKLNTKPKLPLEKPKLPSEKPKLQLEKPKALSELMESKESRDTYLKYNQIMRLSQIGLQSNLPVENVSVQTSEKDRIITPTPRPKRPFFNNNPQHRDADRAILISSPVQLDKTSQVLRDKTSFYNIPPSKLIRNSTQSNVAVINIIKDDFVSRQLSVQVLPSVSIECDIPRRRKRQKNFQLIVEKGSNSSSIDENFNGEIKPKEKATTKEKETVETSHTSTQTKNVSTSFDQNYETSIQKLPLDTITVRQLLRDLITALKEDGNAQKKEETQESVKEPVQDETKPTTKCQGVSTDSFEQKSQFVSMEIETRSQGSATNENYSKSQQVQVQIERKEFKDATTMAEETKEFKDAGVLAKDFDNESKEIGIQTLELIRQSDNVESNENFKSTEDKSTGMDSPSRSDSREGSSDSAQSLQQKDTITNREIGIQVRVSSSSSSLSTFNESSSAIVSSSTTTTTSSSALSDELISEGEVIFKHPFPHVPRHNRIITQKSSELEVTQEFDEYNSSASEGETRPNAPRQLESAQSIGEINLDEIKSNGEGYTVETADGDSSSSGEIISGQ